MISSVTINGGEVIANGKDCGIYACGNVVINNSTVTAAGIGNYACGIAADKSVRIDGGTVNAAGYTYGIGGFNGDVEINGGKVTAIGNRSAFSTDTLVKTAVNGTAWSDVEGTSGKTTIEAGETGHNLNNFKKVQFPAQTYQSYVVKFTDGLGNDLDTQYVEKGKAATAPADPKRDGYTFNGWDTDFSNVTSNLTVIAQWKQSKSAVRTVTVNSATVSAKTLNAAVRKAGGSKNTVTTIILGKKVKKISKGAFKNYKKAKTLVVKTKKLKKATVKNSLKGSKITKVKVKVGNKKTNKSYVKKYRKIFTKKNAGRKVKVFTLIMRIDSL